MLCARARVCVQAVWARVPCMRACVVGDGQFWGESGAGPCRADAAVSRRPAGRPCVCAFCIGAYAEGPRRTAAGFRTNACSPRVASAQFATCPCCSGGLPEKRSSFDCEPRRPTAAAQTHSVGRCRVGWDVRFNWKSNLLRSLCLRISRDLRARHRWLGECGPSVAHFVLVEGHE